MRGLDYANPQHDFRKDSYTYDNNYTITYIVTENGILIAHQDDYQLKIVINNTILVYHSSGDSSYSSIIVPVSKDDIVKITTGGSTSLATCFRIYIFNYL